MSELYGILKGFVVSTILTLLTTAVFCGIFTAETETIKSLFG